MICRFGRTTGNPDYEITHRYATRVIPPPISSDSCYRSGSERRRMGSEGRATASLTVSHSTTGNPDYEVTCSYAA
jgi:hypothetical protein